MKREMLFKSQHITAIGIFGVVMVLVMRSHACGGGGGGDEKTTPTPTKILATKEVQKTNESSVTTTGNNTGNTFPVGERCFSIITAQTITNVTIKASLDKYNHSGFFENLLEQNIFLKILNQNATGCSNVQGFMIELSQIISDNKKTHKYEISKLNGTLAETKCNWHNRTCGGLPPLLSEADTTVNTISKITRKETKEASTTQTVNIAARTDDNEVPLTVIVIPVAVVFILIVIAIVFGIWFKRRSTRNGNKDDKTIDIVDRTAGPINGDVYTVVDPSTNKKTKGKSDNDLVYTELSHMKSEESVNKHPEESGPQEYAHVTHVLKAGETAYENVNPLQSDDNKEYANVAVLKK